MPIMNQTLFDALESMNLSTLSAAERTTRKKALESLFGSDFDFKKTLTNKQKDAFLLKARTSDFYKQITGVALADGDSIERVGPPNLADLIHVAAHNLVMITEYERIDNIRYNNLTNDNRVHLEQVADLTDANIVDPSCALANGLLGWNPSAENQTNCKEIIRLAKTRRHDVNKERNTAADLKKTELDEKINEKLEQLDRALEQAITLTESEKTTSTRNQLKVKLGQINDDIVAKTAALARERKKPQQVTLKRDLERLRDSQALLKATIKMVPNITDRLVGRQPSIRERMKELNLIQFKLKHDGRYAFEYHEHDQTDPNAMDPKRIYCKRDGDSLTYFIRDPSDTNAILTDKIECGVLGIPQDFEQVNLDDNDVQGKFFVETDKKFHTFGEYEHYNPANPNIGIEADERKFTTICLYADELAEDMNRSDQFLKQCRSIADDPERNRVWMPKEANFLIKVVALSEISTTFKEQVKRKGVVYEQASKHGLEGQVVYRGVYLGKDDVKCATWEPRGKTICIEQDHTGRVVDRSTTKFSDLKKEEREQAAIKFAEMLLYAYEPGSGDRITISGGKEHADQAQMVYAALLTLTSPDGKTKIKLDPSLIKVDVPGCNQPSWFGDWRESYKARYIPQDTYEAQIKESTAGYRERFHKVLDDDSTEEKIAKIHVGQEMKPR